MYKYYRVLVTSVDYCVEYEDVFETYWPEDQEWTDEQFDEKIEEVKSRLPQSMELEVECEPGDLDDMVVDAISEETGWLVNSFTYDVLDEKVVD